KCNLLGKRLDAERFCSWPKKVPYRILVLCVCQFRHPAGTFRRESKVAESDTMPRVRLLPAMATAKGSVHSMDNGNLSEVIILADSAYRGISGFVPGSRGSLMLDVVFVAMFVVVPVLAVSVYLVKYRRQYALHKKLQLATACVLLVAVLLFELDIRLNGWE